MAEEFLPIRKRRRSLLGGRTRWVIALVATLAGSVAAYGLRGGAIPETSAGVAQTGEATITSRPEGLEVEIDAQVRGITPLTLRLPVGSHEMRIQAGTESRILPLDIDSERSVHQYVDLSAPTPAPTTSGPKVTSEPKAAAIVAPASARPRPDGWVTFKSPVEMRVLENGRPIATTSLDRVMLPPGTHRLELVNDQLEFQTTLTMRLAGGEGTTHVIKVPDGSLSVNALPWANVQIDGREAGTTPLANLAIPLGSHEIVWKHPQLGQRQQTVTVTAKTPTRVGIDFSR